MASKNHLKKYKERLSEIPAPGGNGCHPALLGVANHGVMAGLSREQIFNDLRQAIKPGGRYVPDQEIWTAITKACTDPRQAITLPNGESYRRYLPPRAKPIIRNGKIALQNIIKQGTISAEADLCDSSPVCICGPGACDPTLFLSTLYERDDLLWVGEREEPGIIGKNIMCVTEWIRLLDLTRKVPPFFIINPLSGKPAEKKTGDGLTYRGDRNVHLFKYALVEYDTLSHEDQIRFWSAVKLPIRCLVSTGGKSIHALLDVQKIAKIDTYDQWQSNIKNILYDQLLTPMSVDPSCGNPARLSRLPGHYRAEKNNWQRLLWLSPVGRSISNE